MRLWAWLRWQLVRHYWRELHVDVQASLAGDYVVYTPGRVHRTPFGRRRHDRRLEVEVAAVSRMAAERRARGRA